MFLSPIFSVQFKWRPRGKNSRQMISRPCALGFSSKYSVVNHFTVYFQERESSSEKCATTEIYENLTDLVIILIIVNMLSKYGEVVIISFSAKFLHFHCDMWT